MAMMSLEAISDIGRRFNFATDEVAALSRDRTGIVGVATVLMMAASIGVFATYPRRGFCSAAAEFTVRCAPPA